MSSPYPGNRTHGGVGVAFLTLVVALAASFAAAADTSVTITAVTDTAIVLNWSPGNLTPQPPGYYRVCWKPDVVSSFCCAGGQSLVTSSTAQQAAITGLSPGTAYTFKVMIQKAPALDLWHTLGVAHAATLEPASGTGSVWVDQELQGQISVSWTAPVPGTYDHIRVGYKQRWLPIPLHKLCARAGDPGSWSPPWTPDSVQGYFEVPGGVSHLAFPATPTLAECIPYDVYVYGFVDDQSPGRLIGTTVAYPQDAYDCAFFFDPLGPDIMLVDAMYDYEELLIWWVDTLCSAPELIHEMPFSALVADAYERAGNGREVSWSFDRVRETAIEEYGVDLGGCSEVAIQALVESRPEAVSLLNQSLPPNLQFQTWVAQNAPDVWADLVVSYQEEGAPRGSLPHSSAYALHIEVDHPSVGASSPEGTPFAASGPAVDAGLFPSSGLVFDDDASLRVLEQSGAVLNLRMTKTFYPEAPDEGSVRVELLVWLDTDTHRTTADWTILGGEGHYEAVAGGGTLVGDPEASASQGGLLDTYDGEVIGTKDYDCSACGQWYWPPISVSYGSWQAQVTSCGATVFAPSDVCNAPYILVEPHHDVTGVGWPCYGLKTPLLPAPHGFGTNGQFPMPTSWLKSGCTTICIETYCWGQYCDQCCFELCCGQQQTCACGSWSQPAVSLSADDWTHDLACCGDTITVPVAVCEQGSLTIAPHYACDPSDPDNCPVSFAVNDPDLGTVGFTGNYEFPVGSITGPYEICIEAYCNGAFCSECRFTIGCEEPPSCDCGSWESPAVALASGCWDEQLTRCGEDVYPPPCVFEDGVLEVVPDYTCDPDSLDLCPVTYTINTPSSSAEPFQTGFQFPIGDVVGSFTACVRAYCNGEECGRCCFTLHEDPGTPCTCHEWVSPYITLSCGPWEEVVACGHDVPIPSPVIEEYGALTITPSFVCEPEEECEPWYVIDCPLGRDSFLGSYVLPLEGMEDILEICVFPFCNDTECEPCCFTVVRD